MKKLSLLSLLVLTAAAVQAAPAVNVSDLSEETLKGIATEKQRDSIDRAHAARQRAEKKRADEMKEAKEVTENNDRGLKKTIQKRQLNTMLPPCEREPEAPREPGNYTIRY